MTRKRSSYYRPMRGRKLRRYLWRRLLPWPIPWLFGWRQDTARARRRPASSQAGGHHARWLT